MYLKTQKYFGSWLTLGYACILVKDNDYSTFQKENINVLPTRKILRYKSMLLLTDNGII